MRKKWLIAFPDGTSRVVEGDTLRYTDTLLTISTNGRPELDETFVVANLRSWKRVWG